MLSNPSLMVSAGSRAVTSISSDTRSLTACAYSARFRRWNGRHPGFGSRAAARSIVVSSAWTNASTRDASGRRAPAGGIMPSRSLRMIFSVMAGVVAAVAASKEASDRPPALPRSLWQATQYCATRAVFESGDGDGACAIAGDKDAVCAGAPLSAWPAVEATSAASAAPSIAVVTRFMGEESAGLKPRRL